MFEVSTFLEDDSAELVSGGANGLVNVSLSNSATSLFGSTFVKLIGEFVVSIFGEVLGTRASLSKEVVEEEVLDVSSGSRVSMEMGIDTTLGVSTFLEDDSAELVSGGANGLVNVSLSNSATSLFGSTFVKLIGEFVVSIFGEVLGTRASLSKEVVEEEVLDVSSGSRVSMEMGIDTTLGVPMESYCNGYG
nr:hypothetical protein [Tanacetum cinerariifolium]